MGPSQRLRERSCAALLAFAGLLTACGGETPEGTADHHPWYRAPHNPEAHEVTIAPWMVHPVRAEAVEEARAELAEISYVQVSPGMASHYAGQEVRVPPEARPFLVRALDAGGSALEVRQSATSLWVRATGGTGEKIVEQPIVVLLDPTPIGIFVTVEPGG